MFRPSEIEAHIRDAKLAIDNYGKPEIAQAHALIALAMLEYNKASQKKGE